MSKNKQKRAFSVLTSHKANLSQVLCYECGQKRTEWSPSNLNKIKKRDKKCASVKNPSRVASFEASKVNSVRKPKQKQKKNPLLLMSQHETPVLGKYFTANNSNQKLPQAAHLESINEHGQVKQRTNDKLSPQESKLTQTIVGQQSTINAPLSIKSQINRSNIIKIVPLDEVQANLDSTIDKLKSKQQTIQILNKTIQTRLVDVAASSAGPRSYITREDTYEVEMNFYIEKITLLQKQLYEKNRLLRNAESKNQEFAILARNTKKMIKENTRLREQLELSIREVEALKKLLAKTETKLL